MFLAICSSLLLAAAAPQPVHEEAFVRIGGIEQWITIKGDDRSRPVVLFLHGGPGDAYSPFADSLFDGWQKDFTLVQWDQRGAGRTYAKNGTSVEPTMTIDRMVADGIEVSQYLTKHLHHKKIILVGGSWGSILGIHMIHARPDLFSAYIGEGQMVNWRNNVAASYARVLELARAADDKEAVDALTAIGPPPWTSLRTWPKFRKWQVAYQKKLVTAPEPKLTRSAEYDTPQEREQDAAADDFSFIHFTGMTMTGPITTVDLPALGTHFAVPIFVVQGEKDLTALPEIAKAYFDTLDAPHKEFHSVRDSGHEPSIAALAEVREILNRCAASAQPPRPRRATTR